MNFVLQRNESSLVRRATPNYEQDYTTGGDVIYTPSGSSFTVDWSTEDDFVVGLGWTTGSTNPINFSGTFGIGSGTALLSIYGWSENPLVEYYIVEDSASPPVSEPSKAASQATGQAIPFGKINV
ncbi:endo-beta-1,4-xylanase [Botrytis cinerea]